MSGSGGKTKIAIDTSTLADGDSIAAYLVASGTQLTATGSSLNVNVTASALPSGAATETTLASILTDINLLTNLDGAVWAAGSTGSMPLAVRKDTGAAFSGVADGDFSPLQVDADGNLRVSFTGTITANIEGDYAEDSAHVSGDRGIFGLSIRNDNQATTFASATGDYQGYATDQKGAMYTKSVHNATNLQQIVTVGTTALPLPATPLTNRTSMMVQLLNSGTLYLGSATVDNTGAARGFALTGNGAFASIDAGPSNVIYGIANAAGKDVAVWEFA